MSTKAWREANKERLAERSRAHYVANKEATLARHALYREDNKEAIKLQNKIYGENNKEKISAYYEENKERIALRNKVRWQQNKEQLTLKNKIYREQNKEQIKIQHRPYQKVYEAINKDAIAARKKTYYAINKDYILERNSQRHLFIKQQVINHYGGKCACPKCNEDKIEFLTIDHINGGGKKHRKESNITHFYGWIINNNYPTDLQCLCFNCNKGRELNSHVCPHEGIIMKQYSSKSCQRNAINNQVIKEETFIQYTGGKCVICGESNIYFLTIDHTWGSRGPYLEGIMHGNTLYRWLRDNGYPQDRYRLLCFSCNCSHVYDDFEMYEAGCVPSWEDELTKIAG